MERLFFHKGRNSVIIWSIIWYIFASELEIDESIKYSISSPGLDGINLILLQVDMTPYIFEDNWAAFIPKPEEYDYTVH